MRIGNSYSASYKRLKARTRIRNQARIARLCERLDKLVEHAEGYGRGTATRQLFISRADKVRESLRAADH